MLMHAAIATSALASSALAFPTYLNTFESVYGTSTTLPARMDTLLGSRCYTCHHPPVFGDEGTCYRLDFRATLYSGFTAEQAIRLIDQLDSDGDGVPNGAEIRLARVGQPGEIGYHPGLIGATGTDPCFDPTAAVTNQLETPPSYCYPNCDGSTSAPILNALDFGCFLTLYRDAQNIPTELRDRAYANCDASTFAPVLNAIDFSCFLQRYQAGCK